MFPVFSGSENFKFGKFTLLVVISLKLFLSFFSRTKYPQELILASPSLKYMPKRKRRVCTKKNRKQKGRTLNKNVGDGVKLPPFFKGFFGCRTSVREGGVSGVGLPPFFACVRSTHFFASRNPLLRHVAAVSWV